MGFRVDPRELRDTPIDLATMNATYVAKSIYATVNPFDSPAKVGVAKLQLARSISLMNPVRILLSLIKLFWKIALKNSAKLSSKS